MSRRKLLLNTGMRVLPLRYVGGKFRAGCFPLTARRVTLGSVKQKVRGHGRARSASTQGSGLARARYRAGKPRRASPMRTARNRGHRERGSPGGSVATAANGNGTLRSPQGTSATAAPPPPAPTAALPRPGAEPAKTTRDRFLGKWFM